jgi:hypothetical protein
LYISIPTINLIAISSSNLDKFIGEPCGLRSPWTLGLFEVEVLGNGGVLVGGGRSRRILKREKESILYYWLEGTNNFSYEIELFPLTL